jgi:hypothetical protein
MAVGKPATNLNWCPDGSGTKITAPTDELATQGYVPNESVAAQNLNYVFWLLDNWVQWLAGQTAVANAATSLFNNARLNGGGVWSWNASSGTLTWSQPFGIAVPGIDDSFNQCASNSVSLADGYVAYVGANVPFSTTADMQSGNTSLTNAADTSGVSVGDVVKGSGIPTATTVVSVSGSTIVLSNSPTTTVTAASLIFVPNAALSMTAANNASVVPDANTLFVARRFGPYVILGANSGQMILRDTESRQLLEEGFGVVIDAPAGLDLSAGQAVYISDGTDGQTAGSVYLCDAGIANGATRSNCAGLVMTSAASGSNVRIVSAGFVSFGSYAAGSVYYVDPATPGALTTTKPVASNLYMVRVGYASSTSMLLLSLAPSQQNNSASPWPQYGVASESQLASAISQCATAGGGVILTQAPYTISSAHALPDNVVFVGRGQSCPITCATGGSLTLGSYSRMQDCSIVAGNSSISYALLTAAGNTSMVRDCTFTVSGPTATCLSFVGNGNQSVDNVYVGVLGSGGGIGIAYLGAENSDDKSTFTEG